MEAQFVKTTLRELISVKQIVSLHYFEFSKDYIFEGEKHDFWEFLYVDKGEVEVLADSTGYKLKQGDIIFHKPNEFHSVWANRQIAPNLVVLTFECDSAAISFFRDKIFSLDSQQARLLAQIINYGFQAFEPPFDNPREHTLIRNRASIPGAEQYIKLYIELLLLHLYHSGNAGSRTQRLSSMTKDRSENDLIHRMIAYMEQHIYESVTLEQIYNTFNLSKSHALSVFKERTGQSIMRYYRNIKIEQAKRLIREDQMNFTEIAELLQYSSVHQFSRQFKSVLDMSPSEYARSVKAQLHETVNGAISP
jgi:AraC-like DNA-binding protein